MENVLDVEVDRQRRYRPRMPTFGLAPLDDWLIDTSVPHARRARLLGETPFEEIIAKVRREARISRIGREIGNNTKRGFHRYVLTFAIDPCTIDLWHNSRGGYRAQYYIDAALGDEANAYAVESIASLAEALMPADKRRRHLWPAAAKSICHPWARAWIHQGHWFRHWRREDRLLRVSRWQDNARHAICKKVSKFVNWAMLIPCIEDGLVIKGQWLTADGLASPEPPKAKRAQQLYKYGFT